MARTLALLILGSCLIVVSPPLWAQREVIYNSDGGVLRLVFEKEVGEVERTLEIRAVGAEEVTLAHGNLTGVLFQAVAQAEAGEAIPLELRWSPRGNEDAELIVVAGEQTWSSDAPAWVWAVAAKYADHQATGAVTLVDEPTTGAEKRFHRRWMNRQGQAQRLVWARYHPALDHTLMGFYLVAADAIAGDPVHARNLPLGLTQWSAPGAGDNDARRARTAASDLASVIESNTEPGDCVMLNDVDSKFVFKEVNGKLRIDGDIHYHFARRTASGAFRPLPLTEVCRNNPQLVREVNPSLHAVVREFAALTAFFRHVQATSPEAWDRFAASVAPVLERAPKTETPIAVPLGR